MDTSPAVFQERLKKRIMRRVYAVWFLRSVAPLLAVEFVLLSGVAVGVLAHISIRHIALNALAASSGLQSFLQFFIDNFFVKSIQSRLLAAVYVAMLAFFGRDIASAIKRMKGFGQDGLLRFLAIGKNRRALS